MPKKKQTLEEMGMPQMGGPTMPPLNPQFVPPAPAGKPSTKKQPVPQKKAPKGKPKGKK